MEHNYLENAYLDLDIEILKFVESKDIRNTRKEYSMIGTIIWKTRIEDLDLNIKVSKFE